jgi:hypothetical protein
MTTPDHDESKPRRRWPWCLSAGLSLLLVVYPLSMGPAVVVETQFGRPTLDVVNVVYWPLIKVSQLTNFKLFESYCNWWLKASGFA